MPYSLSFTGDFFQVADFIKGIDSLVDTNGTGVAVDGRLVTLDGFALNGDPELGFPHLDATFAVTTYVTPPRQGLTAGATPRRPTGSGRRDRHPDLDHPDHALGRGGGRDHGSKHGVGAMKDFKRPDLKLPEVKVPGFLGDLFNDLRDRHLLPLVGLLLIAIVVVPFALKSSGGSDSGDRGRRGGGGRSRVAAAGGAPQATAFTGSVTGLRDYRRRLRNLTAKDPFKQQYAGAAAAEAGAAAAAGVAAPASSVRASFPAAARRGCPSSTPTGSGRERCHGWWLRGRRRRRLDRQGRDQVRLV